MQERNYIYDVCWLHPNLGEGEKIAEFYNLDDATLFIEALFGKYYKEDETEIIIRKKIIRKDVNNE